MQFDTNKKTPLHMSILLGICIFFSLVNFAMGWIIPEQTMFEGVSKTTQGGLSLLANNGSRQLGAAVFFFIAIIWRNPYLVFGALIIRTIGEFFDVILYGFMMEAQLGAAIVASILLLWEIFSIRQLLMEYKLS